MAHLRWRLVDPYEAPTSPNYQYIFRPNPREMTSPFRRRNITVKATTALAGLDILIEGAAPPVEWSFAGDIQTAEQYEELRSWVYEHSGRRLYLFDHFGRRMVVVLLEFKPTPKRAVNKYWRHTYDVIALVLSVGAPTVGEVDITDPNLG